MQEIIKCSGITVMQIKFRLVHIHLLVGANGQNIIVDKWTLFRNSGIKVVRYADDFVLMGKEIKDIHIRKIKSTA